MSMALGNATVGRHFDGSHRDPALGWQWQDLLLRGATLALAVLWIYSPVCNPTLPAEWLGDDDQLLTENLTVQHRLSEDPSVPQDHLATLARLWLAPEGLDYFPLSYTALWAQWPFFSMDPRTGGPVQPGGPAVAWPLGYHATSVVLHLLGAVALWQLLAVMQLPGSWLGALLFAVHPVCVESVAWVSEVKNTLSLPLFLLAATEYVRFDDRVQGGRLSDAPWEKSHFLRSVLFFLLAMLAKPSMVAFPLVILLYTWWKRNTVTFRDLVWTAPFFLISLVLGLVTIGFQHGRAIGQEAIIVGGPVSRAATAGMAILWYLLLLVWPAELLPNYPKWAVDPPQAWQFLPWLFIVGGGWWCWQNRSTWGRHALFAFGFFLLMLAPVLGFITISYMRISWVADHFVYLPMVGIVSLVAAGVASLYERTRPEERPRIAVGVAVVLGLLAVLSFRYAANWVSEDALWNYTLARNDAAWAGHNRLGAKKLVRGHLENHEPVTRIQDLGALHHFMRATALRPDLGETQNSLGAAYLEMAKVSLKRGDNVAAGKLLGMAKEQFVMASRLMPHAAMFRKNLADAFGLAGSYAEAAATLAGLVEETPNDPLLLNNYGVALFWSGRKEDAIVQYQKALRIAPGLQDARKNLAVALGKQPVASGPSQPNPAGGAEDTR